MITHVVLCRITTTIEKHVCFHCGNDAYLLVVGYEVVKQNVLDQIVIDAKYIKTFNDIIHYVNESFVGESIYQETLHEQQQKGPQEHTRHYYCFPHLSAILSGMTGKQGSGEASLYTLMQNPKSALWVIWNTYTQRSALGNTLFQDTTSLAEALKKRNDKKSL